MKIYYDEGPEIMTCGVAGEFRLGVPKEVPDEIGEILLHKGRHKLFREDAAAAPAPAKRPSRAAGKEE